MEDVFEHRARYEEKLAEYEGRDELIAQAQDRLKEAESMLQKAADALRLAREAVLPQFLMQVQAQACASRDGLFKDRGTFG